MFKNMWEKTQVNHNIDVQIIKAMISHTFPDAIVSDLQMIVGGCANINIKFTLIDSKPLLLRIYLRDKHAVYKEQKIAKLVKDSVPVPHVYIIGDFDDYRYAITEFIPGITLRDFLLNHFDEESTSSIMYDCGKMLAAIASYTFKAPGFFVDSLNVKNIAAEGDLQKFMIQSLRHPNVIQQLHTSVINEIAQIIARHADSFPDALAKNLVHGDYDPANILVIEEDGRWQISAVVDFEFAFSGSWLWDLSNMLRYAHKMPVNFQTAFLKGITDCGFTLPSDWRVTLHVLNLASLLDCLTRTSIQEKPYQYQDICELLDYIVSQLKK